MDLIQKYGKGRVFLVSVVFLVIFRGALHTFVIPPWQHPDEPTHFEHVHLVAALGTLPEMDHLDLPLRRAITASMLAHKFWKDDEIPPLDDGALSNVGMSPLGIYTFSQPRLYYALAGIWLKPWIHSSVDTQLYVVRLFSVFLNLWIVLIGIRTVSLLFPENFPLKLGVTGFLLFQPELTDIMSAANNDALINFIAAGFFLTVVASYRKKLKWWTFPLFCLLLAGAIMTKATVVSLILVIPFVVLFFPWKFTGKELDFRRLLIRVLVCVGIFAGLLLLYGTLFQRLISSEWFPALGKYLRADMVRSLGNLIDPAKRHLYYWTTVIVYRSFWVAYGWRHVVMPVLWYWIPSVGVFLACIGILKSGYQWIGGWKANSEGLWRACSLIFAFCLSFVSWGMAIVRSMAAQFGGDWMYLSHGRYAFVAIVPFGILMTTGLLRLFPQTSQPKIAWIYFFTLFIFDAIAFWGVLVPYYY